MKKTEFISVLSAAALIVGTFGACSHNKNKEAGAQSPEHSAAETQTQDQSQASTTTDTMSSDQAAAGGEVGGQMGTEQTELGGTASTQTTTQSPDQAGQTGQTTQTDWRTMQRELLNETAANYLHHVNQKEIQWSQWAQEKAQSQQVKNAAQKMLQDHQALENRVQSLASTRNWNLRSYQPATWEQVVSDRIQNLSGDQFDQAFVGIVHNSHEHTLQELAWLNSKLKDQQLKNLVRQTLQRVRAHRQMTAPMHRSLASGKWQGQDQSQTQDMGGTEQTTTQSPSQDMSTEQGGQEMPTQGAESESDAATESIDQAPSKDNGN